MLIVFSGVVLASSWHGGVLFVFVLFVLWTQWGNPVTPQFRKALIALIALLEVMQGVQTLHSGLPDVAGDYSAGRPAAAGVMAWRAGHPGKAIVAFGGQSFENAAVAAVQCLCELSQRRAASAIRPLEHRRDLARTAASERMGRPDRDKA